MLCVLTKNKRNWPTLEMACLPNEESLCCVCGSDVFSGTTHGAVMVVVATLLAHAANNGGMAWWH